MFLSVKGFICVRAEWGPEGRHPSRAPLGPPVPYSAKDNRTDCPVERTRVYLTFPMHEGGGRTRSSERPKGRTTGSVLRRGNDLFSLKTSTDSHLNHLRLCRHSMRSVKHFTGPRETRGHRRSGPPWDPSSCLGPLGRTPRLPYRYNTELPLKHSRFSRPDSHCTLPSFPPSSPRPNNTQLCAGGSGVRQDWDSGTLPPE